MYFNRLLISIRFGERLISTGNSEVKGFAHELSTVVSLPSDTRLLKVAILGAPNAGKSTLINKIIGHPVLCVSKKVHTTRRRERAAVVRDDTQIVFVDTPGLVSRGHIKKHNLENSFLVDGMRAVSEASIVGVIHDAANIYTRGRLDSNILHILNNMKKETKSFLVLNKIDSVKGKNKLLALAKDLTGSCDLQAGALLERKSENSSDEAVEKVSQRPKGYSNFSEVFMVSAINGDGVQDVLDYLEKEAEEGEWLLPPGQVTDRSWPVVVQELVRGRLMDALPQEVPYNLKIETEYFHQNDLGEIIAVVLVTCPLMRHKKMLVAGSGRIVRDVATLAESDARHALKTNVRLRVVVTSNDAKSRITRS